LYIKTFCKCNF